MHLHWRAAEAEAAEGEGVVRGGSVDPGEPGLYYLGIGGVRLEDVVVVTAKGNRNLTDCPQFLEI